LFLGSVRVPGENAEAWGFLEEETQLLSTATSTNFSGQRRLEAAQIQVMKEKTVPVDSRSCKEGRCK
jgi:hypothetical protein